MESSEEFMNKLAENMKEIQLLENSNEISFNSKSPEQVNHSLRYPQFYID